MVLRRSFNGTNAFPQAQVYAAHCQKGSGALRRQVTLGTESFKILGKKAGWMQSVTSCGLGHTKNKKDF